MRVAVDARHLGRGRGVARYLESMLDALSRRDDGIDWIAVLPSGRENLAPPGISVARAPRPTRLANACAAALGTPRLDRTAGGADAVWIPAPAPVAWSREVPAVLTLHDISWEARPGDFTAYERMWHALARPRRMAGRASAVACVSESTRDAVLSAGWPVDPSRLSVIPEAPMALVDPPEPSPGRYLLYVGALEPRKGVDTLSSALQQARAAGLVLPLIVVGSGRERAALEHLEGVSFAEPSTDGELAALYAGATALVLPSWLEGFGLPPVEAAAFGVPTVASDLPVFHESLGDGFIAVPPGDSGALGRAIFAVATDSALRDRVGQEAKRSVSRLSWSRSAGELAALIHQAASGERSPR